jgi:MFS family permease
MTSRRRLISTVMGCHFVAAFAALGMPPFFTLILEQSLHANADLFAGGLYVLPILCTAISSPWWGRLADRYGTKRLLLRAQLGLALSFLLAGFAENLVVFAAALALQGLLGGTFAASNAYLATLSDGKELARSLHWMQWSARAALVAAPVGLGILLAGLDSPVELYRYLALLPLLSAMVLWRLPGSPVEVVAKTLPSSEAAGPEAKPWQVYWLQFALVFSTVVTFPYFISHVQLAGMASTPALGGWLFGLPHLVYLACAIPLGRRLEAYDRLPVLAIALVLLLVSLLGQVWAPTLGVIAFWRVAMGLGMTVAMLSLNALIAGIVRQSHAGRTFSWLESGSKWGAVLAGLVAGLVVHLFDVRFPFFIGAAALLLATGYLLATSVLRPRLGNS